MTQYYYKYKEEECHALHEQFVMYCSHYSTHDTSKSEDTKSRHYALCLLEGFVLSPEKIRDKADSDRQ